MPASSDLDLSDIDLMRTVALVARYVVDQAALDEFSSEALIGAHISRILKDASFNEAIISETMVAQSIAWAASRNLLLYNTTDV